VTRTISIDIYDRVQAAEYGAANATALLLLIFSFIILMLVYGLNRKIWAVYPVK
jgi:molybdate transport system permease protein